MDLTRRQFTAGAAGIAAVAVLPPLRGTQRKTPPLVGATLNRSAYNVPTFLDAAQIYDKYLGMPLATGAEKIYMGHGAFGAQPPAKMAQLAAAGCEFLVSVKPSNALTKAEQQALAKWLAMLKAKHLKFRVALYSEPNDKAFHTPAEWLPYWRWYAPVIKDAGVTLVYEPGCGPTAVARGEALFPSRPTPDELWVDYYATAFRGGSTLTKILAIAGHAGVPAGIGEWGWQAGNSDGLGKPPTMAEWDSYGTYLLSLITARKVRLGALYFGAAFGNLTANVITGPKDARIPMIHKVAKAFG